MDRFIPTLDQLQEAARRLPNPTSRSPHSMQVSIYPVVLRRDPLMYEVDTYCHKLTFGLRVEFDRWDTPYYRWVYSGDVRL